MIETFLIVRPIDSATKNFTYAKKYSNFFLLFISLIDYLASFLVRFVRLLPCILSHVKQFPRVKTSFLSSYNNSSISITQDANQLTHLLVTFTHHILKFIQPFLIFPALYMLRKLTSAPRSSNTIKNICHGCIVRFYNDLIIFQTNSIPKIGTPKAHCSPLLIGEKNYPLTNWIWIQ